MTEANIKTGIDVREHARTGFDAEVAIELDAAVLVGSGQNVSAQGIYFTAEGVIPVRVRLGTAPDLVAGELVRVENLGDGRIGLAVRFADARPDLVR